MAILSFLYIVTTKVIQHNLEKKVPTYVYYLYKNLENQNKWLLEKIKKDNPDKNAEDVIASMDAKSYCETFAKDINTRGKNNCDMLDDAGDQEIVYNCNRTFNHVVNSDGSFSAIYNPTLKENESISDYNYCDEIKNLNNFTCRYKPKKVFNELAIPNTDEQLYNCTASSVENIEIDNRNPLNIKTHFKSTNNIYFNILKSKAHKYNFTLNATQGDICKANFANGFNANWTTVYDKILIYREGNPRGYDILRCQDAMNLWNDPTNENYNFSNKTNIPCCGITMNKNKFSLGLLTPPINVESIITLPDGTSFEKTETFIDAFRKTYKLESSSNEAITIGFQYEHRFGQKDTLIYTSRDFTNKIYFDYSPRKYTDSSHSNFNRYPSVVEKQLGDVIGSSLNHLNSITPFGGVVDYTTNAFGTTTVAVSLYYKLANMSDYLNSPCQTYLNFLKKAIDYKVWEDKILKSNPEVVNVTLNGDEFKFQNSIIFKANNDTALKNSLVNQYNKWTNYFKQSGQKVEAKKALSNKIYNENDSINYEKNNHIIYVSIDTPFEKGEMNKNIFAFEQFEDRIIPVGYLANNSNTPLKFDVITRNPKTFKIEKVNYYEGMEKRPLTFCEAMSYTGEKFSPYCGCRWSSSGVLVTGPNGKGNPTYYRENGDGYSQKIKLCDNNFGCIIRPVKPSSGGWF